jgi:hypothetical protein
MPAIKEHSKYRLSIYNTYGEKVRKELSKIKGKDFFLIKQVSGLGTVKCMAHMTERTRHQYLSDVCAELFVRGILARHGKTYYFVSKKKRKVKDNE